MIKSIRSVYNSIKYGRPIGKISKNGCSAYVKGNKTTGIDGKGNIIKTIKKTVDNDTESLKIVTKKYSEHDGHYSDITLVNRNRRAGTYYSTTERVCEGQLPVGIVDESTELQIKNGTVSGKIITITPPKSSEKYDRLEGGGFVRYI